MDTEIETAKQFWVQFNKKLEEIKEELAAIEKNEDPKANVAKSFAVLKAAVVALQAFATTSTDILPAYDIRRTQEEIDAMNKSIRQKEEVLLPRKKFRFSRENAVPKNITDSARPGGAEALATTGGGHASVAVSLKEESGNGSLEGSVLVVDKENETVILSDRDFAREDCNGQLLVQRCKNVTVHVIGVAGSVRLEGLNGCTVLLGPSQTSVYIEDCSNSVFSVACHQLRIHKTSESKVYTRCRTHPIIEDCSALGFGPYAVRYPNWEAHFTRANLADAVCWDNVVDFRWHRTTHSPNWFVIPEGSRELFQLSPSGIRVVFDPGTATEASAGNDISRNSEIKNSTGGGDTDPVNTNTLVGCAGDDDDEDEL